MDESNVFGTTDVNVETVVNSNSTPVSGDQDKTPKPAKALHPYEVIAAEFAGMTYNSRNIGQIRKLMTDVLQTVCAINALPEFATGLRVGDVHYLFSEYQVPDWVRKLIVPAKIVLEDTPTAIDFSRRSMFNQSFRGASLLSPEEMSATLKTIATKSRLNWDSSALIREKVGLLQAEAKCSVYGNRLSDIHVDHIVYLSQKFDDEAQVDVSRWAKHYATTI